jgi:hypothetical protein
MKIDNVEYILVGDKGCIRKDLVSSVIQSGSQVLIDDCTFGFSDYETARAAVTDVIAQLTGQRPQQQPDAKANDYRFFQHDGVRRKCYAVPSDGSDKGRSFIERGDNCIELGNCDWCLEEMLESDARTEITQAEFERFAGPDWKARIENANG